jgi:hypothetical protein
MSNGAISGNTVSSSGGGVHVSGGTFTMSGGAISGNIASGGGGGVLVKNAGGTFTMSGGAISGNTSPSAGGGVYVYNNGTFTMSGGAQVDLNNPVYLSDTSLFITIALGGLDPGTDPVALVEPAPGPGFIGKSALKWALGGSGALPEGRFQLASGWKWKAGDDGILDGNSLPLTVPGETAGAYLSYGSSHFYRFTPVLGKNYTITHTRPGGSSISTAAAWADNGNVLVSNTSGSGSPSTSSTFNADREEDIIIMVYNGMGAYTVKYNELP